MKVAVYYNNKDIRLQDIPVPQIGAGEILVKVMASGICGTDTMEWYRLRKAPRILGHEITGEVAESMSDRFAAGQRVFVSHHVACNKCSYCLKGDYTACDVLHKGNYDPGGYSEYVRVPKINVEHGTYILPEGVTYEEGTLIEPLACAVAGQDAIGVDRRRTVLVLGSGVSGLLNIQLAKLKGAKVVATDVNEYRLENARRFGADKAVHANELGDIKADRIIICTESYKAVEQAFSSVDKKGVILFFAIPGRNVELSMVDFWRNELTVTSSYGAAFPALEKAIALIGERKVDVANLITHVLPLEDAQKGFAIVSQAKESLKVVLRP